MKDIDNPQKRGYEFEDLIYNLYRFYGMDPKKGDKLTEVGDQIDVVANYEGMQLITEVRYRKKPVNKTAIAELNSELDARPPNAIGIYFSMTGFTSNAKEYASTFLNKNQILLFDDVEIKGLFTNADNFNKILNKKIFSQTYEGKIGEITEGEKDLRTGDKRSIKKNKSEQDYILSSSGSVNPIIYSNIYYPMNKSNNYFLNCYFGSIDLDYLVYVLKTYEDIFGFSEKCAYCINQMNYSWFGLGVNSFLKSLKNRDERYEGLEELEKHHSEAVGFVDPILGNNQGLFSISLQPELNVPDLGHFNITFIFEELPYYNSKLEKFFEKIGTEPEGIRSLDNELSFRLSLKEPLVLEKNGYVQLSNNFNIGEQKKEWISGIVSKNPFYKNPDMLEYTNIKNMSEKYNFLKPFFEFEKTITFLHQYHPTNEKYKYILNDLSFYAIPSSGFSIIIVRPEVDFKEK